MARRTERSGHIAHIFSADESRTGHPKNDPVAWGINSLAALKRNGCWQIAGLISQIEPPATLISEEYLPAVYGERS